MGRMTNWTLCVLWSLFICFVGYTFGVRRSPAYQQTKSDPHTTVIRNMVVESAEGPTCVLLLEGHETAFVSAVIHDPDVTGPCGPGVNGAPQKCSDDK